MRGILPIILLVGLIITLIVSGLLWLDHMGVISFKENVYPRMAKLPFLGRFMTPPDYTWEDFREEELRKLSDAVTLRLEELRVKEEESGRREAELKRREEELAQREGSLVDKTRAFEEHTAQYEDEKKRLNKLVRYYENMKPDAAARILAEMDDLDTIEILQRMKDESVSAILMKMDPKRAGELSNKMAR
ncbi:TPA: hypothetical protein DCX15_05985 [bacterium]|nr:hypothetical protein [bacterium]